MTQVRCKRAALSVLATQILFVNDDQTGEIELVDGSHRLTIRVVFHPTGGKSVNHPDIEIAPFSGGVNLLFSSWDQPLVYLALAPIEIGQLGANKLFLAVTNTYLDKTNRLEMQFYV
jgi:hypothetical protein